MKASRTSLVLAMALGPMACGGLTQVRAPAQPTTQFPDPWGSTAADEADEEPVATDTEEPYQPPPPSYENVED